MIHLFMTLSAHDYHWMNLQTLSLFFFRSPSVVKENTLMAAIYFARRWKEVLKRDTVWLTTLERGYWLFSPCKVLVSWRFKLGNNAHSLFYSRWPYYIYIDTILSERNSQLHPLLRFLQIQRHRIKAEINAEFPSLMIYVI